MEQATLHHVRNKCAKCIVSSLHRVWCNMNSCDDFSHPFGIANKNRKYSLLLHSIKCVHVAINAPLNCVYAISRREFAADVHTAAAPPIKRSKWQLCARSKYAHTLAHTIRFDWFRSGRIMCAVFMDKREFYGHEWSAKSQRFNHYSAVTTFRFACLSAWYNNARNCP